MSMALAREQHLESIAFPAISCGIYGFPIDEAAAIAVREIRAAANVSPKSSRVLLVAFGDDVHAALSRAIYPQSTRASVSSDPSDMTPSPP
jgi:O-acetyl-ADP-ribose deacetylase (regulator of RNase III)